MIQQKKEGWLEKRRHNRALSERAVIDASVYHIASKCEECMRNIAIYQKKTDAASKEFVRRYEAGECDDVLNTLREGVEMFQDQLSLEQNLFGMFGHLKGMLSQLLVYVDALIRMGDYKYIINTIPEKKIPKYVKASKAEEISLIIELVSELLSTIQDRITIVAKGNEKIKEEIDRIKSVGESMRSGVEKSPEEKKAANDAFMAKMRGTASFVEPVPARAQENENTSSRGTNLA